MSTVTDNDLKRLEDLIINGQKSIETRLTGIESKIDRLFEEVNDFKVEIASVKGDIKTLDEKLTGKINALDEKLTGKINALDERVAGNIKVVNERTAGIDKRLDNQEFVSRGILIALIVAILGGFAKLFGFIGNL